MDPVSGIKVPLGGSGGDVLVIEESELDQECSVSVMGVNGM
jgi:hypothetical protein